MVGAEHRGNCLGRLLLAAVIALGAAACSITASISLAGGVRNDLLAAHLAAIDGTPLTAASRRDIDDRILALDPDRISDDDVRGTLAAGPVPRIVLVHGGVIGVHMVMESFGDDDHALWAADVWHSIKKHWCLEAQRLIRAQRASGADRQSAQR